MRTRERSPAPTGGGAPSTRGEELLPLPVGPVPRVLLSACRPGPPLQPTEVRDGWALFHLTDRGGISVPVALRQPEHPEFGEEDAMAAQFLQRARANPRALGELQALLTLCLERDGQEGQWWWGDVARAVYGAGAKSHHNDHIRLAAALLCRGRWPTFGGDATPGPPPSPWGGSPLLSFEGRDHCAASEAKRCRCPLTARLNPAFARALAQIRHRVPAELLQLPQEGHTNPEGRRPSRAALLRVRTTALHHWHAGEPDTDAGAGAGTKVRSLTVHELLSEAGIDVNSHIRRRHLGDLLSDVVRQLRTTAAWVGVGLREAPLRGRRLLGTVLHLSGPAASPTSRPASTPRPPLTTGPRPSTAATRRPASRAPPLPH